MKKLSPIFVGYIWGTSIVENTLVLLIIYHPSRCRSKQTKSKLFVHRQEETYYFSGRGGHPPLEEVGEEKED
jgi:hypothetical protein